MSEEMPSVNVLLQQATDGHDWANESDRLIVRDNLKETAAYVAGTMLDAKSPAGRSAVEQALGRIYRRIAVIDMGLEQGRRRYEEKERQRRVVCRVSLEHMARAVLTANGGYITEQELVATTDVREAMMGYAVKLANVVKSQHGLTEFGRGPHCGLAQIAKLLSSDGIQISGTDAGPMAALVEAAQAIEPHSCWDTPTPAMRGFIEGFKEAWASYVDKERTVR